MSAAIPSSEDHGEAEGRGSIENCRRTAPGGPGLARLRRSDRQVIQLSNLVPCDTALVSRLRRHHASRWYQVADAREQSPHSVAEAMGNYCRWYALSKRHLEDSRRPESFGSMPGGIPSVSSRDALRGVSHTTSDLAARLFRGVPLRSAGHLCRDRHTHGLARFAHRRANPADVALAPSQASCVREGRAG